MLGGSLEGDRAPVVRIRSYGRSRLAGLIALVIAAATLGEARLAHAQDRVAELTQTMASSSEKTRLSATVALGNLGDRRALKPLVTALADASAQVRAVAATALGQLGHKAALPALKNTANDDADETVRKAARDAALAVAKANQLPAPWPEPAAAPAPAPAAAAGTTIAAAAPTGTRPTKPGFGKQPRTIQPSPDIYVLVNTTNDDSPGKADKAARKEHADILRQTLVSSCNSNPLLTTVATDAKRLGLDPRHIDLSVVKMDVATVGGVVEVDAQLRLAISDGRGKMLSFLSGGAKIQVPKTRFDPRYLPKLRREALENAVRGMFDKLVTHLRDQRATS
jgi:HEAT repeats